MSLLQLPKYSGAALAAAMLCTPALAEDEAPTVVLKPASDWYLTYADDSCRLSRVFGEDDDKSVLYFERYRPSDSFMLVVAGRPLRSHRRDEIDFRFGPKGDKAWREREVEIGDLGEFQPALIFTTTTLVPLEDRPEDARFIRDFDPEGDARREMRIDVPPEIEEGIGWFEVKHRRSDKPVRFDFGSLGKPMAAMRACTDELMTHWGVDVEAHRELTRPVVPASNPGRWVVASDYPTEMLRKGMQGIVKFRLSVDAEGKPTQCHIQKSTRPAAFDEAVCKNLMRRAEFEPALGKDGTPIASYWHSTVRFQIGS